MGPRFKASPRCIPRGQRTLLPRHFCPAFPNLPCSTASPWSLPGSPVYPRPESPDSIPALLTHLRPLSPLVRRRPWCVGRKPRGSFLAEHGGPAASPPRPGLLLSSRLWLHVRRGGVGRWPSAQETDRGGHRARQLLRGSKSPSSRERLPPSSGDLKMAAAQRSANQRAGSGC